MFGTTALSIKTVSWSSRVLLSSPPLRDRLLGVCTWALAHLGHLGDGPKVRIRKENPRLPDPLV